MVGFLIVAGLFALLAAAATWAVVRIQRIELATSKEEFEKYKLDTGKEIAEANARAAEAKLELEKFRSPRSLSLDQQDRIVVKMNAFAGQQFDVGWVVGDPEVGTIGTLIEDLLRRAGLKQVDWKGGDIVFSRQGRPINGMVSLNGIVIQMDSSVVALFWPTADALAKALNAEGIPAKAEPGSGTAAENKNAMHVLIGKKQ